MKRVFDIAEGGREFHILVQMYQHLLKAYFLLES